MGPLPGCLVGPFTGLVCSLPLPVKTTATAGQARSEVVYPNGEAALADLKLTMSMNEVKAQHGTAWHQMLSQLRNLRPTYRTRQVKHLDIGNFVQFISQSTFAFMGFCQAVRVYVMSDSVAAFSPGVCLQDNAWCSMVWLVGGT